MSEMKKLFRPEFLNRLDEIIVFKSLTEEQIAQIVDLMVADLRDRLIAMDMTINLTPEARALVAKGRHRYHDGRSSVASSDSASARRSYFRAAACRYVACRLGY